MLGTGAHGVPEPVGHAPRDLALQEVGRETPPVMPGCPMTRETFQRKTCGRSKFSSQKSTRWLKAMELERINPEGVPSGCGVPTGCRGKDFRGRLELNQRIPSLGRPFLYGFLPPLPRVHTLLECREGTLAQDERGWGKSLRGRAYLLVMIATAAFFCTSRHFVRKTPLTYWILMSCT